jgi:ATP-dependent RNA helicase DeaD
LEGSPNEQLLAGSFPAKDHPNEQLVGSMASTTTTWDVNAEVFVPPFVPPVEPTTPAPTWDVNAEEFEPPIVPPVEPTTPAPVPDVLTPDPVGVLEEGLKKVTVNGVASLIQNTNTTWEQTGVDAAVVQRVKSITPPWDHPSHVQSVTLPDLLRGHDYIVQAPSGQGKTGAFVIAALAVLAKRGNQGLPGPLCVFVTVTQELVDALKKEVERLNPAIRVCRVKPEPNDLGPGADRIETYHIVAGSIGKLAGLMGRRGNINLRNCKFFVADEADKLLSSHSPEFTTVIQGLDRNCQRTFWSATIDDNIAERLKEITRKPTETKVERVSADQLLTKNCENYKVFVQNNEQKYAVMDLIQTHCNFQQCLVFTDSPRDADRICAQLQSKGWKVESMHGKNDSQERAAIIKRFRDKAFNVLVATEILSRGLDCADLNCVVNWGTPTPARCLVS